jgi:hypothetical protein
MLARKLTCIAVTVVGKPTFKVNCSFIEFKPLQQHVSDVLERCRRQLSERGDQLYSVHLRDDLIAVTFAEALEAMYTYSLCENAECAMPHEGSEARLVLHLALPAEPAPDADRVGCQAAPARPKRQKQNQARPPAYAVCFTMSEPGEMLLR